MTIRYGSEHVGRIPRQSERDDKVSEQRLKAKGCLTPPALRPCADP